MNKELGIFIFKKLAMISCLLISLTSHSTYANKICNPAYDPKVSQFIIGYGSLMNEKSKRSSNINVGKNIPVYVTGFERGWIARGHEKKLGITYLGIREKNASKLNAVYFKLNKSQAINDFDKRENTYCRVGVPRKKIQSLIKKPLPQGQYWIYLTTNAQKPSTQYPIAQSYIDIFLTGCIALEKTYQLHGFSKDCVNTTHNWSSLWVNDRIHPRGTLLYTPYTKQIDGLVKTIIISQPWKR